MKLSILISASREMEDTRTFAKKYWNFRQHVDMLQLKGQLPAGEVRFEFVGSYRPIDGQLALPLGWEV